MKISIQCECAGCLQSFNPESEGFGTALQLRKVLMVYQPDGETVTLRYGSLAVSEGNEGITVCCSRSCASRVIDRLVATMQGVRDARAKPANVIPCEAETFAGSKA